MLKLRCYFLIFMHITYFSEPAIYFENFVKNSLHGSISQSFYWGKLQETVAARGKFWAFAVEEKNEIIGTCVLIKHKIGKKSCYLYAHRGPVLEHKFDDVTNKVFDLIIAECDKIALVEKALFLRIDPAWHFEDFDERSHAQAIESFQRFFHKKDFIPAHAQYQPLSTLQLDLTKSLDELRKEIRTMGKRNLKKAEESGLDIIFTTDSSGNELRELDRLNLVTSKRDNFYTHNIDY
ncbi:MAG: peptidoglycan bridge formation glycyltransferase FemA/FemB family protein, partial [Patescibacteria group bacterium]|nr:peptidoglycan bridge formation glycyltransferase FemA/FemB family protein [Patescibacteria group bacterium]